MKLIPGKLYKVSYSRLCAIEIKDDIIRNEIVMFINLKKDHGRYFWHIFLHKTRIVECLPEKIEDYERQLKELI